MPGEPRALPGRASLRYLKLEAKRRLAAGEFPALHQAQLAIAREHGQRSWAALKQLIGQQDRPDGHALAQLRWVVSRFGGADAPGWAAPGEGELREHFTEQFLASVPPDRLIAMFTNATAVAALSGEPVVTANVALFAQVRIAGFQVMVSAEADPPHLLASLRIQRTGTRVTDPRVASPPSTTLGEVPAPVPQMALRAIGDLGLPGLVLAGGAAGPPGLPSRAWSATSGWANLEQDEALSAGHRFPAYDITKVVTAAAVLRLAADGRLVLDDPANRQLSTIRLADDGVTARELLLHTGGVRNLPANFAPSVPELAELTGPALACSGRRGAFEYSHAGYAALGQLVTDITGLPYPEAASRMVLRPLSMTSSWFPASWPAGAAGGYDLSGDGSFVALPGLVCTMPAAGGLWTTASDLVRLALGWASLLPRALAAEAFRGQAERPLGSARSGLGWIVNDAAGVAGHASDGPGGAGSVLLTLSGDRACVALANRPIPVEEVNAGVLRATGGGAGGVPGGTAAR
jgi:CubicO group peptidase (beta-lactamase class C family)